MKSLVAKFIFDVCRRNNLPGLKISPYWLTLSGVSGYGKTFLARMACTVIQRLSIPSADFEKRDDHIPEKIRNCDYCRKMRERDNDYYYRIRDQKILFIDDVYSDPDKSGFVTNETYDLLDYRIRKWTIITTNKSLNQITEIDNRIASRLERNGNVFFQISGKTYEETIT